MKYIFALLCCLPLLADTIGEISYEVPAGWTMRDKMETEEFATYIYVSQKVLQPDVKEQFKVHANDKPSSGGVEAMQEVLAQLFSGMKVGVTQLESFEDGFIYEWSVANGNEEIIHGWGRTIASEKGTVILDYDTKNVADLSGVREVWLKVLREAS